MDVATLIYNCLKDNISNENVVFRFDEFDSKSPALQLLLENYPARSTWVTRGVYRIEHRVRITIYLKPIRYDLETIVTARTNFFTLKEEINEILAKNKFNLAGIVNLDLIGGWDDEGSIAVGRGVKATTEPIIWKSKQEISCVYYIVEELETE